MDRWRRSPLVRCGEMVREPVFLSHGASRGHDTGAHPEHVARIEAIESELAARDWCGYAAVASPEATRAELELVHPAAHIDRIAAAALAGAGQIDPDTVLSAGSFEAALHACGGALELVRRLVAGGPGQVGFSAHRPPGHHATASRAMGFCLFNNVAVAARCALDTLGLERVLVLDWDVHHGNGTSEIFWDTDALLLISIHQMPLYPGSGAAYELGSGRGYGHTVNLPVPAGSGDETFVSLVRDVAVPLARVYRPELVLVSAGYDAHADDPLADCRLSDAGFGAMAALVRDLGHELAVPVGCVLEGGYAPDALARCVALTMETLAAAPASPDPLVASLGVHPLARQAQARLAELWPAMAAAVREP
jgi:acetoin utilization deacetylase AcuC-like enzyme